jgi:hypothetical protein
MDKNLQPIDESYNRMVFFNSVLAILPDHKGGWMLETHPYVSSMHFNRSMQKVVVNFRVGYMFGEAMLQKNNGLWELVSSVIQAVE